MPAKSAANAVWTIGHSTRSIEEFLNLLAEFRIQTVADVRSHPGSRKYPQYNQDTLAASLEAAGISYVWMKDLGGRRRARPDTVNIAWRNTSFRGYADYMESPQFDAAFAELEQLAARALPSFDDRRCVVHRQRSGRAHHGGRSFRCPSDDLAGTDRRWKVDVHDAVN